jgi:hypothetical protein
MAPKPFSSLPKLIVFLVIGIVLINPFPVKSAEQAGIELTTDTACRIGINAPLAVDGYDINSLRIASLLDWGAVNNPTLPDGVEYIRVLRLRDDLYPGTLANLPGWVQANPGSVWVVGNEPDTTYEDQPGSGQDGLLPEVYADRYYEMARIIRRLDRSAQIGFGPVVQPTPIRIRYLQRAWDQLVLDAGNTHEASSLVDIWVPHSFILNEEPGAWGTGIPPGFENDHDDAVIITNYDDTHSITIFQNRILAFRLWMASIGEREKPLWITEYGSLFPPVDPPGEDYYNVSDEDTALFMLNTFNFMLLASDHQSGMPADGDQLVQRWFWYSLNDHRYHFGGSVYNPDSPEYGGPITQVGQVFISFQNEKLVSPDLLPVDLFIKPIAYSEDPSLVNYQLDITVDNNQFDDAACGQLWVYDGDPNSGGSLIIGPLPASAFRPDYGQAAITAYWMEVEPETVHDLCVGVDSIGIEDADPENNMACYSVYLGVPTSRFLPLVHRN